VVKEFWKSVEIWLSYRHEFSGTFLCGHGVVGTKLKCTSVFCFINLQIVFGYRWFILHTYRPTMHKIGLELNCMWFIDLRLCIKPDIQRNSIRRFKASHVVTYWEASRQDSKTSLSEYHTSTTAVNSVVTCSTESQILTAEPEKK